MAVLDKQYSNLGKPDYPKIEYPLWMPSYDDSSLFITECFYGDRY